MLRRVFCAVLVSTVGGFALVVPDIAIARDTTELITKGWSKAELTKILAEFEDSYRGRLGSGFAYRIDSVSSDEFDVHFPVGIHHPYLAYLVNYVQYPKGFDLSGRRIGVLARVTLTAGYPAPSNAYVGMRARIYVPSDDHEYNLVYVAVGSDFFRQQFTFDRWDRESDGRVPEVVKGLW